MGRVPASEKQESSTCDRSVDLSRYTAPSIIDDAIRIE